MKYFIYYIRIRFRAVLVFKKVEDDKIQYLAPHDAVETQELKEKLIEQFNGDWKEPAWRDIIYTGQLFNIVTCIECHESYIVEECGSILKTRYCIDNVLYQRTESPYHIVVPTLTF